MEDVLGSTTPEQIAVVIVILTTVALIVYKLKMKTVADRNTKDKNVYSNCENPNCVRCQTYKSVLPSAKNRFHQYITLTGGNKTENSSLLQRMKISLHNYNSVSHDLNSLSETDQRPEVFLLKNLETSPWWNIDEDDKMNVQILQDVKHLEQQYEKIREEMLFLWERKQSLWINNSTPNGKWSVYHLINQGRTLQDKVTYCPFTYSSILNMKCLMKNNVFGNVAFSVIQPSTIISKHYGPTNIRVRCHLGLITPICCELEVAGESRIWNQGKCLLFDDSYLHGVTHTGSHDQGIRAILMADLWHPSVTKIERQAIDYIFSPQIS